MTSLLTRHLALAGATATVSALALQLACGPSAAGADVETETAPPSEHCMQTEWGAWHQEAALPGGPSSPHLRADALGVLVLGAGTPQDPLGPVYAWLGPDQSRETREPVRLSAAVAATVRLGDDRLLLVGTDEPRSVLRSSGDAWEHLATLPLEPGPIVLGQTSSETVVAYHLASRTTSCSGARSPPATHDKSPRVFERWQILEEPIEEA